MCSLLNSESVTFLVVGDNGVTGNPTNMVLFFSAAVAAESTDFHRRNFSMTISLLELVISFSEGMHDGTSY